MASIRWVLLFLAGMTVPAANVGARVEYVGGTRADISNGAGGTVETIDEEYFVFYSKKANVRIPYRAINLIEYGQQVSRRYIEAILISPVFVVSKRRAHFLSIGYTDDANREQALVFRVDKSHIRAMLVSLEARTGRKIQFQDEEARKAGKG